MRVACVDVPALPLQLLLRARPSWREVPAAVVETDAPQARILWVDARAAAHRVRPGMRYASALALCRALRAAPVSAPELDALRGEILVTLQARTPRVEPDAERPGVYWLDPAGLGSLYGPLETWACVVHDDLTALGLTSAVVVGFARLPCWAIARGHAGALVLASAADETERAGRARLLELDVPAELREALAALGIHRLDELLALPRGEVGLRFGPEASRLHARFAGELAAPFQAAPFDEPITVEAELDPPDDDAHRLLFCIKGALHALMAELGRRALALGRLVLRLSLERHPEHVELLEPAQPNRDALA